VASTNWSSYAIFETRTTGAWISGLFNSHARAIWASTLPYLRATSDRRWGRGHWPHPLPASTSTGRSPLSPTRCVSCFVYGPSSPPPEKSVTLLPC